MRYRAIFILCAVLTACGTPKKEPERLIWEPISFDEIAGWESANHEPALQAFAASCAKPRATDHAMHEVIDPAAMADACSLAMSAAAWPGSNATEFFEQRFTPVKLTSTHKDEGMLTGYYIPILNGSLHPSPRYPVPVYGVPLPGDASVSRAAIEAGALRGKGLELLYVDDPVMLFFMHIQGSGFVRLEDGRMMSLNYAGKNNHSYLAIGAVLADQGEIPREELSLQSIRAWLYAHPAEAPALMNQNESYVYFTQTEAKEMPKGAQGVPLTPQHSLAIDPTQLPYGLPVFINTHVTPGGTGASLPFRQLLITQDTGGAIKGPLRGDIFFGLGQEAEQLAGYQKSSGRWFALVPNAKAYGQAPLNPLQAGSLNRAAYDAPQR